MEYSQILKSCKSSPSKNYKADINLAKKLDRKGRKFPVKIRHIHKIKKENSRNQKEKSKQILSSLVFLAMKIRKNIRSMQQKKFCEEKHADLLLIGEEGK